MIRQKQPTGASAPAGYWLKIIKLFLVLGVVLMADLSEIKPSRRNRVYDLVREAGVNVEDWANFKGDETKAATNPKYCYDWAFVEPGRVVVLN